MIKLIIKYLIFFSLSPIVYFICIVRPIIHIRFCDLYSRRFGDFIDQVEGYLCHKNIANELKKSLIVFFWDSKISNQQLKKMTSRVMFVFPRFFFVLIYKALIFFKKKDHILYLEKYNFSSSFELMKKETKPHIYFDEKEKLNALLALNKLGIIKDAEFICIHNRDSQYLDKALPKGYPIDLGSWNYNNHRDFSIKELQSTAEYFASLGYYVLRMGTFVKEKYNSTNKRIIDYANSDYRNDLMDLFLLSKCKLLLCGGTGMAIYPMVFNKPVFGVNLSSTELFNPNFCRYSLITFKRLKDNISGKLLSIKEILQSEFAYTHNANILKKNNITPIENTSSEILLYAKEINKIINNKYFESSEDIEIQKNFWSIYNKFVDRDKRNPVLPKISPTFLRNNIDLLN